MRFVLPLLLVLSACASHPPPVASSGPPRTTIPPMDVVRPDYTPEQTTTTTQPVIVPATTAPAVEATVTEVVPLEASEPAPYSSIEQVIADAFGRFGGGVVDQAIRVARCESHLNPRAYNPSGASGLFQVMPLWADDYQRVTGEPYYDGRFNAWANSTFAAWLWSQSHSWAHWSCKP